MKNDFDTIPNTLGEDEKLVRIVFSPFHVDKKNPTKLTRNAFRPPPEIDEVSVNRLSFTTANDCKRNGKVMNSDIKKFVGLASIKYTSIVESNAFARVSKLPNNLSHADIFFGFPLKRGEPLPLQMIPILDALTAKAAYFQDTNQDVDIWTGEDISNC
jgi:hypothetical protein